MVKTISIKYDNPDVKRAMIRIGNGIITAKREGHKVIKIIHGYGASGEGGSIKHELSRWLTDNAKMYGIKLIIKGEDFKRSNSSTIKALERFPKLKEERDLERDNEGVTFVIF